MTGTFEGRRILVVEDSPVVADDSSEILQALGCSVVGPAGNMASALQLAEEGNVDAAIVDLNIRGGKSFAVLKILEARGIPFLITSGYADWTMPEEWSERPRLPKPYTADSLRMRLAELLVEES
ncbi:MAG: response regulator [Pseudomonadota bacterium]|nr:response regulator [Sphingomonas sp.]MDQ3479182.1 response regulator [Pseudomonadota bacterium]